MQRAKSFLINILISILSLLIILVILEFYFRVFFIQTSGFGRTLASKKWGMKYWHPTINSLGYRDREWTESDLSGKIIIAVVGDSFVAGHGIKNLSDRFQGVLASKLGKNYAVISIGRAGAGTMAEIRNFEGYPFKEKVDIIIWSYFLNDIEVIAGKLGKHRRSTRVLTIPERLKFLVKNSYFFNFIYWRLYNSGRDNLN